MEYRITDMHPTDAWWDFRDLFIGKTGFGNIEKSISQGEPWVYGRLIVNGAITRDEQLYIFAAIKVERIGKWNILSMLKNTISQLSSNLSRFFHPEL